MSAHTPGPWKQGYTLSTEVTRRWTAEQWAQNDARERRLVFANFTSKDQGSCRRLIAVCESEDDAPLIAAAPDLKAVANNFEITGPDADGLVWLVLHGKGTSGKAMFNLGTADKLATQCALLLEAGRRAAIAKATGSAS